MKRCTTILVSILRLITCCITKNRSPGFDHFENAAFGRVMALDGVVQTTERDEFIYHEMMTHVPLLAHGNAKHVLIIGGGDGAMLRSLSSQHHRNHHHGGNRRWRGLILPPVPAQP
jgi:hypothetical protein